MLPGPCRGRNAFFAVHLAEEPGQTQTLFDPGLDWCDDLQEGAPSTYVTPWHEPQVIALDVPDREGKDWFVQFLVSNNDARWTALMLDDATLAPRLR